MAVELPDNTVETSFRVRYAETDQMGLVHHAAFVVWLEVGRSQWMRAYGQSYAEFERDGLVLAVSEVQLRYHQSAHYDELVTVRCGISAVQSRRLTFVYEVLGPEGARLLSGYTRHICLNKAGEVAKFPAKWRAYLAGHV